MISYEDLEQKISEASWKGGLRDVINEIWLDGRKHGMDESIGHWCATYGQNINLAQFLADWRDHYNPFTRKRDAPLGNYPL